MLTGPFGVGCCAAQPPTPLSRWIAFALPLNGRLTLFGIFGGTLPCGPFSITTFFTLSFCGSTSTNGTSPNVFGFQSGKISRSAGPSSSKNMPFVRDHRRDLVERQRHELPLLRQELQQVGEFLDLHLLLESLGHQRLVGLLQRRDLVLAAARAASPRRR